MGEAQDEEGDGWGESIGFGNGEEGEEGLKSGADKEERAEGEVAMKCGEKCCCRAEVDSARSSRRWGNERFEVHPEIWRQN